jgi:DUF4097 and DUF4098 domain-containing protein YvlB
MKAKILILITVLIVSSFSGCSLLSKKYLKSGSEQHQVSIAGKQKVKLENVTGNITINHSSDSGFMTVRATKEIKVKKKDLDKPFEEIRILIDTLSSEIRIYSEINERTDYEITIPSNIEIEIENVNGEVTTNKLNNDMKIDLVNGDVSLDKFSGKLECDIVNGTFSADIDSTKGMDISTINGSVKLTLSNFLNARIKAETTNGRITDENLRFSEIEKEKKVFRGKLGTGEVKADIRIETLNGKIKLIGRNEI